MTYSSELNTGAQVKIIGDSVAAESSEWEEDNSAAIEFSGTDRSFYSCRVVGFSVPFGTVSHHVEQIRLGRLAHGVPIRQRIDLIFRQGFVIHRTMINIDIRGAGDGHRERAIVGATPNHTSINSAGCRNVGSSTGEVACFEFECSVLKPDRAIDCAAFGIQL